MEDNRPFLPAAVLERLRADPLRAPETLALAAGDVHGPSAARWVAETRGRYGDDPPRIAKMAKSKHATWARFGGAATGFGGLVTVLPDLAALAWIQSRLVFCVAGAYGFDPNDAMRPAELLTIQGIYDDPVAARRALDGEGQTVMSRLVDNRMSRDQALVQTLALMAGKKGLKKLAGKAIPGFAVLFNAVTNERDVRRTADDAIRFYGG